MLIDAAWQVVCHADVERAIGPAGKNIDVVRHQPQLAPLRTSGSSLPKHSDMSRRKAGLRPGAWSRHRPRLAFACARLAGVTAGRSEEHTSELQSLMRISYAVFCLKKKKKITLPPII